MVEIPLPQTSANVSAVADLLLPGELIAVVDDSPEIVLLLSHYLAENGFKVVKAGSSKELLTLLSINKIALVLLDIGLPDRDGNEILREIVPAYPELAVIMVTGTTDIQVALDCLRQGADDYLTKPVSMRQFNHTITSTLKKRRLAINSRLFYDELQNTNAQMRFLHHLNLKMNTAYLSTVELQGVLRAILFGITSNDGLRFNRAFLALFDNPGHYLEGKLGVGPSSREEAGRIWSSIEEKGMGLTDMLKLSSSYEIEHDIETNRSIQALSVSSKEHDHILIQATIRKKAIHAQHGRAENCTIPKEFTDCLGVDSFVVVPLYSPARSLGVIIVDNFVTNKQISIEDISALEIFASQASLAIEQSHLYADMEQKILELEQVTEELEKSKDLLIEAERTAAIGNMSAQLLHGIRNPVTSIGATSRLLSRKVQDNYVENFLKVITEEANKIENVLDDIASFTENTKPVLAKHAIFPLIRRCAMVFYSLMKKSNINYRLNLIGQGPSLRIDEKKIRQVFLHLLRNSIEAMTSGGSLLIDTAIKEKSVFIYLTDTGPGIPEEALPHIKDPFFTTKTYGNGMGLTLVEQIVEAHNGSFNIEGDPGQGTRVTVRLPLNLDATT